MVVFTLEEGLFQEDHSSKHASKTPNVKRIIVCLQIDKKFRSFEVSGSYSNIVLLTRVIILCKTPINESQLPVLMINHDIVRFNISVNDSLGMAVVQGSQDFENVESNIKISEALIKRSEVHISSVNILHNECWSFGHWISNNIQ